MITREEFTASFASTKLDELQSLARQELALELQSKNKADALEELYQAYARANGVEPEALPAPVAPADKPKRGRPPKTPAAEPLAATEPPPAATPAPVPTEIVYEARSRTGRAFHKGGRVFGVRWETIGTLTPDERALLAKYAAFVQVRSKA